MQPWQQSCAGRQDQSLLVHEGVAQPTSSPVAPDDSATALWSGVGVWHKTSSMLWVGSFRAVLWRAPCPGQQGSERGLRIKGHEPSSGYICRGGVWRSPQIETHLICRESPLEDFRVPVSLWGVHSHGPRTWGSFPLSNWPKSLALNLSTSGTGQWTPAPDTKSEGAVGLPGAGREAQKN